MVKSGKHFFQIGEEKFLDLKKPTGIIETLLWLSGDESSFMHKNHHILYYWKGEEEMELIEDFGLIKLEVNSFFKLLLSTNPGENLFFKYFQSSSVSDSVKSIQLNCIQNETTT